jgi:hypothetical protein
MTEAEWLTCSEPEPMLEFLHGKPGDRKLRLFSCACCRRIWALLKDERSRNAVETAERYVDGIAEERERHAAEYAAGRASDDAETNQYLADAIAATSSTDAALGTLLLDEVAKDAKITASHARFASLFAAGHVWGAPINDALAAVTMKEKQAQSDLLRDIIGNPFHLVTIDCLLLNPAVVQFAQSIYKNGSFGQMLLLADTLEVAGCTNTEVIEHCRGPGPHVRGCWVLDLLLGKE